MGGEPLIDRAAVLTGSHVAIRPFDTHDAAFLRDASNDLAFQAAAFRSPVLPQGMVNFQRRLHDGHDAPLSAVYGAAEFAVARIAPELDAIGVTGLYSIDRHNQHAEIGVSILAPGHHRQGLGSEALRIMLDFTFGHLAFNRVYAHVKADNVAGLRMCQRVGFSHEGTLRAHRLRAGEHVDLLVLGILRSEWQAGEG